MGKFNKDSDIDEILDYADSSTSKHNLKPEIEEISEEINMYINKVKSTVGEEMKNGLNINHYMVNGNSPVDNVLYEIGELLSSIPTSVTTFEDEMKAEILILREKYLNEMLADIQTYLDNNDRYSMSMDPRSSNFENPTYAKYLEKKEKVEEELKKLKDNQKEEIEPPKEGFWSRQGNRFVDDWDEFVHNVKGSWAGDLGVLPFVGSVWNTASSTVQFAGDLVTDTGHTAVDSVNSVWNFLFDVGSDRSMSSSGDYWDNIGEDYAENWDIFKEADGFWEGAGGILYGTGSTVLDGVQTVGVGVVEVADFAVDAVEGVWDFLF